jgi:hypothetical protein
MTFKDFEGGRFLIDLADRPLKATHEVFMLSASTAGDTLPLMLVRRGPLDFVTYALSAIRCAIRFELACMN